MSDPITPMSLPPLTRLPGRATRRWNAPAAPASQALPSNKPKRPTLTRIRKGGRL